MDIYIGGVADRKAALNGDSVAIELYSIKKWKVSDAYCEFYSIRQNLAVI